MSCDESVSSSNPFAGILNSELKTIFKLAIDALLLCDGCSVPCRLTFSTPVYEACTNCANQNPSIGKKHTNISKSGAGVPLYASNQCSVCNGTSLVATEVSETLYMIPLWDYKQWFKTGLSAGLINARNPEGYVQTFSKIELLPKIKKAKEIRIDTNIEEYVKHDFERFGEPEPLGFGESSYIVTIWKRK